MPQMPALSEEGLKGLVALPLVGKIATTSSKGEIRITPVWFRAEDDGTFLMNTWEDTGVVRNLRRNPKGSMMVDSIEWPYMGAHYWGTLTAEGPEDDADGMAALFAPYLGDRMDPHEYAKMLIGWGTRVYVRFHPERKTTWDFSQG